MRVVPGRHLPVCRSGETQGWGQEGRHRDGDVAERREQHSAGPRRPPGIRWPHVSEVHLAVVSARFCDGHAYPAWSRIGGELPETTEARAVSAPLQGDRAWWGLAV